METSNHLERRAINPEQSLPRVSERADGSPVLAGYAAVFYRAGDAGTEYWLWDDMVERIMPGAFDAAIRDNDDVRALVNHDVRQLLGRRGNGTVRLSVDDVGLRYEVDMPDTSYARDVQAIVGRGDVPGSSFAFRVGMLARRGRVVWAQENRDGVLVDVREIHDLELVDVSPVTYAAYPATGSPAVRDNSPGESLRHEAEAMRRERDEYRRAAPPSDDDLEVNAEAARAFLGTLDAAN